MAPAAALASVCAERQGRFGAMVDELFVQQDSLVDKELREYARDAAVPDIELFDACMADPSAYDPISVGRKLGAEVGIRGTPSVAVNGYLLPAPPSEEEFLLVLDQIRRGKRPTFSR